MLHALYIFVDDDFGDPLYADPDAEDLDPELWEALCEAVNDALEGDGNPEGFGEHDGFIYAWRLNARHGLSFVAVAEDVKPEAVDDYLVRLTALYLDEVDNPRSPERSGIDDIVVEVIPPWEE